MRKPNIKGRISLLILFSFFTAFALPASARSITADYVLVGGRVWTGDGSEPKATAVAIRGNKILGVGDDKSMLKLAGKSTRRIDLGGKFVMPGINDSHIHFLSGSLGMFEVNLNGATTIAEFQSVILKFAKENPDAPWITGRGWQYSIFGDRFPTRADIDAVVSDRPVFLRAYDGHSSLANTKALEIAGVTAKTEFKGFGEIVRDASGNPTGMFKEDGDEALYLKIPRADRARRLKALRRGIEVAHSLGITSIQNAHGSLAEVELYEELLRSGELKLRTSFAFSIDPKTAAEDVRLAAEAKKKFNSPMLRVHAVKIMIDGVIESHTAAMLAPYANKPETSGSPTFSAEALNETVALADRLGLQVYIHAIGDRGVRMALDAFEHAIKVNGRRDSRFRIEHIETIQAADMKRFKELGVIASMEPIHADPATIDVWSKAIGAERSSRGFAWRALENAGATLIFSSDYPASISMSPWRGLHTAVNRRTFDGFPAAGWFPEHRVSVDTALRAYTANGAFASFEESLKGRVKTGMMADLIVLDRDPFKVPASELHKLSATMTIFDGGIVTGN